MALTYTEVYNRLDEDRGPGGLDYAVVDVTFDSSYPAGGEAADFTADLTTNFTTVHAVVVAGDKAAASGYVVTYDHTNSLFEVFYGNYDAADGVLIEIPDATNISAVVVRCVVFGVR